MTELYEFDVAQGDDDDKIFEKLKNDLVIFMFSAPWCPPCRRITPVVKSLAVETKDVNFYKVDVDQFQAVTEHFKVNVMPTFVFIYKGKIAYVLEGANEAQLRGGIEILTKMKRENV